MNDIADALSRFKQPLPEPLSLSDQCEVRWDALLDSAPIFTAQSGRIWPHRFGIGEKMVLAESADSGFINRSFVGSLDPAGRFSIRIGVGTPHFTYILDYPVTLGMHGRDVLGVPLICITLYLGGPAGTMHVVQINRSDLAPRQKYARLNPAAA